MQLTMELDKIIENAGLTAVETQGSYTIIRKNDPQAFFLDDVLRVLTLFSVAAWLGASIEWNTFSAAADAAPFLSALPRARVRTGVTGILASEHPEALAPLITAGGLSACGFASPAPCLHSLREIPPEGCGRLWALVHLCRADSAEVCAALELPQEMCSALCACEEIFARRAPLQRMDLKQLLCRWPAFDFAPAAAAFAVLDPVWDDVAQMYRELLASREPYLPSQLAVTVPQLLQAGVPQKRMDRVVAQLVQAVIKEPKLNTYPVLTALAATVGRR